MVVAGLFGGIVNYFLGKPDDVPPPNLNRSVVVGVAAAFLVPLFLNMISSNLIELIKSGDSSKALILTGFCLVASISSTAFIRTLSDRVLSEARQAKREALDAKTEVTRAKEDINFLVDQETEVDQASDAKAALQTEQSDEQKLLHALSKGRWALRSEGGLAKDSGIDRSVVAQLLQDMAGRGLVAKRTSERGTRWFITDSGRASP